MYCYFAERILNALKIIQVFLGTGRELAARVDQTSLLDVSVRIEK